MGEPNVTAATIFLSGNVLTWSLTMSDGSTTNTTNTLPAGYYFGFDVNSGSEAAEYSSITIPEAGLKSHTINPEPSSTDVIYVRFGVASNDYIELSNSVSAIKTTIPTAAIIILSENVLTWSLTLSNGSIISALPDGYYFAVSNELGGVEPNYKSESTSADGTSYTFLSPPQDGYIISAKFGSTAADAIPSNPIMIGEVAAPGGEVGNPSPSITQATISLLGSVLSWQLTLSDGSTISALPADYSIAVANGQAGVAAEYISAMPSSFTSYTFDTAPANDNVVIVKFIKQGVADVISNSITVGEGAAPGGEVGNPSPSVTITAATIFLSENVLTWSLTMSDESTRTTLPVGSYFAVSNGEGGVAANYTNIMHAAAATNMKSYTLSPTPTGDNYLVSAKFSSTSSTLEDGIVSNSITNTTVEFVSVQVNTTGLITWILKNSNKDTKNVSLPATASLSYSYPVNNGSNPDTTASVPLSIVAGHKFYQLPPLTVGVPHTIQLDVDGVMGTANYTPTGGEPGYNGGGVYNPTGALFVPMGGDGLQQVQAYDEFGIAGEQLVGYGTAGEPGANGGGVYNPTGTGEPGAGGSGEYDPYDKDIAEVIMEIKSLVKNAIQVNWNLKNSSGEDIPLLANTIVTLFYKISTASTYKQIDLTVTDGQSSFNLPHLIPNTEYSIYMTCGPNGSGTNDNPITTAVKKHIALPDPSVIHSASLSLSNLKGGDVLATWELKNINGESVSLTKKSKVALMYTDKQISSVVANRIIRKDISPIRDGDDSDDEGDADTNTITSYVIKNLNLGSTYLVSMDFDTVRTSSKSIISKTVPSKLDFTVVPRDKSFALQLVNPLKNSAFDGWDEINALEVFIGDSKSLISVIIRKADLKVGEDFYVGSVGLPDAVELVNGDPHEIAVQAINPIGKGEISETKLGTPLDTPNRIQNTLALPEHSFKLIKGISRDSLSGHNYVLWKRPDDFVLLNKKNAEGVNVGANRITSYKIIRQKMMPVGVVPSALGSGLGASGPINDVEKSWVRSTNNKGLDDVSNWLDGTYTNYGDPTIGVAGSLINPLKGSTRVAGQALSGFGEQNSTNAPNTAIPSFPSRIIKSDTTKDYANNGAWDGISYVVDEKVAAVTFTISVGDRDSSDPYLKSNVFNQVTYDYEWTDTTVIVGEVYKYYIAGENQNGVGEDSVPTNNVLSLINPTRPTFSRVFGDKSVTLSLDTVGNNGGGVLPVSKWFSYVKKEGTNAEAAKKYFDVDLSPFKADGTVNTNYKKALFSVTNNGELLSLKIRKTVLDYTALQWVKDLGGDVVESPLLELLGLAYKAPSPPVNTRAYLLDDNNELLTRNGDPAVIIAFTPFKNDNLLGGLSKQNHFDPRIHLRYAAFKNSQRIADLEPLYSFAFNEITDSTIFKFLVSSPLGSNPSYYIRTEIFLIELGIWVTSIDSSPPRNAAAITYVDAPTDITLTRMSTADKVKVEFIPAATIGGRIYGSMPSDVYYSIDVISLNTNTIANAAHAVTIPWQSTKISHEITNLVQGQAYQIVATPFVKYTDTNLDDSAKWTDFMIRKYFSSRPYVAAAPASKPTNVTVKPLDKALLLNWDAPTQLNGGVLEIFEIFAATSILGQVLGAETVESFPIKQTAVASIKSPEQFSLSSAFDTVNAGILGLPAGLKPIVNDTTKYSIAVSTTTAVGGFSVPFNTYFSTPANGNPLNIAYNSYIEKSTISGTKSDPVNDNYAYVATAKPINVTSISDATSITLVFEKDNNADELIIFANGEVVFDTTIYSRLNAIDVNSGTAGKQILIDGIEYTLTQDSGLFALQQPPLALAVKGFFWVETKPAFIAYNVKISVTGGGSQNIEIRYGKRVGTVVAYSDPTLTTASVATPPSQARNAKFAVDTNTLEIFYDEPLDKGGANTIAFAGAERNSNLYYRAKLFTKTGYESQTSVPLEVAELITTTSYRFSNLSNYISNNADNTIYIVTLQAYYFQQNDPKKPAESTIVIVNLLESNVIVPIRVDAKPIVPIVNTEIDTAVGNKVTLKYNFQSSPNYPIKSVKFYVDSILINSKTYTALTLAAANAAVGTILSTTFTTSDIPSLLNGKDTAFKIVTEGYYSYAQSPPDTTITVRPRRAIVPNDVNIVPVGGDGKTFTVSVVTGGTAVLGYVAIGKSSTGALQVLSQNPIPNVMGGISTARDAANLTMNYSFAFATPVVDVLLLHQTEDKIVARPYPTNGGSTWGLA